jgi:hypothetical protein
MLSDPQYETERLCRMSEQSEICALLACYAACSDKSLQTFRYNLSDRSSGVALRKNPEERISQLHRGGSLKSSCRSLFAESKLLNFVLSRRELCSEHGG